MVDMNSKLDSWKNKLLDMSKRNRLLNYRETKRSTLRFKKPDIFTLWNSFVIDEIPLEFPLVNEDDERVMFSDNEGENSFASEETDGEADEDEDNIITNKTPIDCQKTLRNLRSRSKSVMEEQGVNALYLSFGFLKWREVGYSGETYEAPLVLVPVTIKWESILSPFVLELHEDEIVLNPTLVYKLENDFGVTLPEYSIDIPLQTYLDQIENIVSANQWSVVREVSLGMLSFLKNNMYRDLDEHKDEIVKNPIIRAICGDTSGISHDLSEIEELDFDHEQKAEQLYQVVDSDSSQQEAILCAKKGVSFVLQGPPGTGKSQTITNIIAECLGAGKKVLFVSEKMAALDVVYKRLEAANLADFCLVLHSHKANKKEILDQLGKTLQMASKKATVNAEAYQTLDKLDEERDALNQYDKELHTVIEPLHKSIYDANGILAELQDSEEVIFQVPDIRRTSNEQYRNYISFLRRYADLVATQKFTVQDNPWRDTNVSYISNELRHDINARGKSLADNMKRFADSYDQVRNDLQFSVEDNFEGAKSLLSILNVAKKRKPFLDRWILQDDLNLLRNEIIYCKTTEDQFAKDREDFTFLLEKEANCDGNFVVSEQSTYSTSSSISEFSTYLDEFFRNDKCFKTWEEDRSYNRLEGAINDAEQHIEAYKSLEKEILKSYEREIFDIQYDDIYLRFKVNCTSTFKIFNSEYRNDKKLIRSLSLFPKAKITDDEILDVLSKLREFKQNKSWLDEHQTELFSLFPDYYEGTSTNFENIREHITEFDLLREIKVSVAELSKVVKTNEEKAPLYREHFGDMYKDLETNWDDIWMSLQWVESLKNTMGTLTEQNAYFITCLAVEDDYGFRCDHYAEQLESYVTAVSENIDWLAHLFEDPDQFYNMRLIKVADRCEGCYNNLSALEEWIDLRGIRQSCFDLNLGEYINVVETQNIPSQNIVSIFEKRFFTLWLDSVLPEFPAVANFRRRTQDDHIKDFKELDKSQFVIAQSRIRQKLISNLPSLDHFTSGVDEISILRRELSKQRKIMPIRKLFSKIPNLILKLKPCLMMSPLTVSLYLESDWFSFDTVIFDEASQITTENAIGAILRGKQVIIAGDSKQLPPTNFFSASVGSDDFDSDDDSDEDADENAYESILEEASGLPERTLLWHYRSRHEHLIAFSNAKIYHNNLITFPSAVDNAPDKGVEFVYVPDGFYDRGGKKGNQVEAKKVAELVFDHFKNQPDRSLGVIAFGETQQLAIDGAVRKLREENPSYEKFFEEEKEEPFFIKSLENVQGDERDTIIFSIGYAKDASGVMHMNFGPLGKAGGERRLNVAITRAKFNVKLVSSIMPTDIDLSRVTTEGPKLLRSYIEFAQKGPSVLEAEITENGEIQHESPFETAVYNFLDRKGYKVATQVGCSGYRIDMAIKHPTIDGQYALGIECDGATYHSARTARERDRLRQDVLESMGWKIYRIWSTDWIKDPVNEEQKLVEAIETAIHSYSASEESSTKSKGQGRSPDCNDFLIEEERKPSEKELSNPYHFQEIPRVNWWGLPRNMFGQLQIEDCVMRAIETLYPVHFDEICRVIAPLLRREKTTSVVKNEVEYALSLVWGKTVNIDQFYFPKECDPKDIAKIPCHLAGKRSIKYISKEETASGMLIVANACVGISEEGLFAETIRAFGFSHSGPKIASAMQNAYNILMNDNWVEVKDDKIIPIP